MKTFLIALLFLLISNVSFADIKIKATPKPSDVNSFYPYSEGIMTLSNFPESSLKEINVKGSRIFKVPIVYLSRYGIKEGVKVQIVNLITGIKNDYLLKESVYAILPPPGEEDNFSEQGRLHVILNDDLSFHKKIAILTTFDIPAAGFAYIGIKREIFAAKLRLVPTKTVKEKFVFEYKTWDPKEKGVEIRSVNILGNTLFVKHSPGRFGAVLRTKVDFFGFTTNYDILTRDLKFLNSAKWGNDSEVLLLQEADDVNACYHLFFINKEEPTHVPLPCSTGNR